MALEMRVKVKNQFRNPRTNRMATIDSVMNVPINGFWLRRLDQGDCEKIKAKSMTGPKADAKKDPKKRSK